MDICNNLQQIEFSANEGNKLVTIRIIPSCFKLIGVGTDAVVVQHHQSPLSVFKVFAMERLYKKEQELLAYKKLGFSMYFPRFISHGDNYLEVSFEQGITLYDCLIQGIVIPEEVIGYVDNACAYAREKGLNPRDIHLKNILLHEDKIKIVDISEYVVKGSDTRWDDLVQGYRKYYHLIKGKKVPTWVLEWVKNTYYLEKEISVKNDIAELIQHLYKKA